MKTLIERIEDKVKYAKDCMIIDTDISVKVLEEVITALREQVAVALVVGELKSAVVELTQQNDELQARTELHRELNVQLQARIERLSASLSWKLKKRGREND
jgi:hypothetical protein